MHICFAVHSNHGDAILDPEYCEEHPLGGSETAVVKMAQCLRSSGVQVTILANHGVLPGDIDVFVAVRALNLFEQGLRPGKLNYLWCQDDIDQRIVEKLKTPAVADRIYCLCDGLIMVSHYQAGRWMAELGAPADKLFVSSNGIDLPRFQAAPRAVSGREPHAYYASTPFRGLAQLLELWPIVRTVVGSRARLKICSSLQVYRDQEKPEYQALYDQARSLEGVDYLGSVGQRQLREVASSCRALAYPCVFAETACIAAMEAMASGCVVVGTALGALPETAWRNPLVPLGQGWGDVWIEQLLRVLVDDRAYEMMAAENLQVAELLGWARVANKWLMRFHSDRVKRAAAEAHPPQS